MTEYEVVLRNAATGGRVRRVLKTWKSGVPVRYSHKPDALAQAGRLNDREHRAHRNVAWTIREVCR